ncbi:LysE family translocator [Salinicola halophilus]|uniref:LysE family translocator n=1 Tax=Salinicola halophilus TaxID=184065 RepID=UPI0013A685F8|nr:LysE family transporter [Salinicola halophilus]
MDILLYAFTVMYTPGPVNLLGMNAGLRAPLASTWGFFAGVALAIFCWFVVVGFAGQLFVVERLIPSIALAGSLYILYLAFKVYRATPEIDVADAANDGAATALGFRDGFLMQLLNPKNSLLVIPITTVMFPGRGYTGLAIVAVSALIAAGGGGAPATYFLAGKALGKRITQPRYLRNANRSMALLLVVVAGLLLYDYGLPLLQAR